MELIYALACLLQTAFRRADGLLQTPETYLPRENKEELGSASSRCELGTGFVEERWLGARRLF
jgi:hypothetical protein